jgi:hypothetical protein
MVEDDFGQQRFLTEDPSVTFRRGNFNRVPVIVGVTEYEVRNFQGQCSLEAE